MFNTVHAASAMPQVAVHRCTQDKSSINGGISAEAITPVVCTSRNPRRTRLAKYPAVLAIAALVNVISACVGIASAATLQLSVDPTSVSEGGQATAVVDFLNGVINSDGFLNCDVSGSLVVGGTAEEGKDFTLNSKFSFSRGQYFVPPSKKIQVNIEDDSQAELDETIELALPPSAELAFENCEFDIKDDVGTDQTQSTITIVDDDPDNPPQASPDRLDLRGRPGETVEAQLDVSNDRPDIGISNVNASGSVAPNVVSGTSGTITYSFSIPQDSSAGQTFQDTITISDPPGTEPQPQSTEVPVTITVIDTTPPTISPDPLELSGLPGDTVSGTFSVSDNEAGMSVTAESGSVDPQQIQGSSGNVTYTFTISPDATVGQTFNHTATVTDSAQNSSSADVTITVTESPPPKADPEALELSGTPGDTVTGTLTVSDDQAGIAASVQHENGQVSPTRIEEASGTLKYSFAIPEDAAPGTINDVITLTDSQQVETPVPVTVNVNVQETPKAPETEEDDLSVVGKPGQSATATFTVSDDKPGITIAAEFGTVQPTFIEGTSGEVTYTFPIPADASPGEQFADTITITDAENNQKPLTVTVKAAGISDTPGLTETQRGVGVAVEQACLGLADGAELTDGQQNLQATCSSLNSLPEGEVPAALSQIAPDELSSQSTVAVEAANEQGSLIGSRLSALRSGAAGLDLGGVNVNLFGQRLPKFALDSALPRVGASDSDYGSVVSKFGVFVNGTLTIGDKDSSLNEPGFDLDASDISFGADYRFTANLIAGAALGFGTAETTFENSGGNVNFDSLSFSLYSTYYQSQATYFDAIVTFGSSSYDTRRRIAFSNINEDAAGSTDGADVAITVGGGYDLTRDAWIFGPYGRLSYLSADIDGYQEAPTASGLELSLDAQEITSLTAVAGTKAIYNWSTNWGVLSPQLNVEWEREFDNDSRLITGRFVNDPTGTRFAIPTDDPDRNVFNVGLSTAATFTNGWVAFLSYETLVGHEDLSQYSIAGGLRLEF